jgi:hypothetical protein
MAQVVNCDGREIKDNYKRLNSPRLAAKSHRSPDLPLSFSPFSPLFLLFPKISRTKAVISNSNHILDPALTHDRLRNSTSLVAEFDCTPHLLHSASHYVRRYAAWHASPFQILPQSMTYPLNCKSGAFHFGYGHF